MPSKGHNLLITPLSLLEFIDEYDIDKVEAPKEYLKYLETNEDIHHYGGRTMAGWLIMQLSKHILIV